MRRLELQMVVLTPGNMVVANRQPQLQFPAVVVFTPVLAAVDVVVVDVVV